MTRCIVATRRDILIVFAVALALRLAFAALTSDTYDPDEFVYLSLSSQMVHGAIPYQDFMFFHPPGILVVLGVLHPLTSLWWPAARVFVLLIDSLTAVLVWAVGLHIYARRQALAGGLIYAASPLALLAAVRVGQDPLITFLGVAGLLVLLKSTGMRGALITGVCLGLAVWIKYPALFFLPIYVAVSPKRVAVVFGAAIATASALLGPYVLHAQQLYNQSIAWQVGRQPMDLLHRAAAITGFWLVLNPLALPAAIRARCPGWLVFGFALGGTFGLVSEVYYHYLDPVVPFAALISAPLVVRLVDRSPKKAIIAATAFLGLWAGALTVRSVQSGLGALRLSATAATVRLLDQVAGPRDVVLADQFEYTFLANRRPVTDYFWDMRNVTSEKSLEGLLPRTAVVLTTPASTPSYPRGFIAVLQTAHYVHLHVGSATLWIPRSSGSRLPDHIR